MSITASDPHLDLPAVPRFVSCGSEDVVRDAWAAWDKAAQDWTLSAIFDAAWSAACDGPTTIIMSANVTLSLEDAR